MNAPARLALLAAALCPHMLFAQPKPQPAKFPDPAPITSPTPREGPSDVWWNDAVFYEIFVRSFKDSASGPNANDGIGDFDGITEKLDYLNNGKNDGSSLGVTGLWLMPIFPSPSYHGYDVTDYRATNPDYGSIDSFKRLVSECHKRGIRVILDLTLNHCSSKHPWFVEASKPGSPTRDWFVWAKEPPAKQGGAYGGSPWHKLGDEYYYGLFSAGMPDFNCTNPAVTQALHDLSAFWLKDVGVDGFRLDAIRHLIEVDGKQENTPETHAWIKDYRKFIKAANPQCMTVGEVWDSSANASKYVGDELDMVFEFQMAGATLEAINKGRARPLQKAYAEVAGAYPLNQYGTFLTNHDQNRVMTELAGDRRKLRLAASLLLTGPGVPFIYYGEEIGMEGAKPDENLRRPMQWTDDEYAGFSAHAPWEAVDENHSTHNVRSEEQCQSSLLKTYQKLIRLRMQHPALRRGSMSLVKGSDPGLYSFLRTHTSGSGELEAMLVVVNLTGKTVRNPALSLPASPLRGRFVSKEILFGDPTNPLAADDQGGFSGYQPADAIQPFDVLVLNLEHQ